MVSERPRRPNRKRKLGRGLSEVSHIFLSGAEKNLAEASAGPSDAASDQSDSTTEGAPDPAGEVLWRPDANLISVTSGDKVPGKTFLAANLAFGLFTQGRSVGLVNADSQKPDILDMIGAVPLDGGSGLATASARFGGLPVGDVFGSFLPAGREVSDEVAAGMSAGSTVSPLAAMEAVAGRAGSVIVDTSPRAEPSRLVWSTAGLTLVVARAGSEAMQAAYVTVKRVRNISPVGRIGLVVNMASSRSEANKCFRKMSEVCRRFLKTNIRDYGYIVHSDTAGEACRRAVPVAQAYPESETAKCIHSILKLIMMDESAIARRRREVKFKTCALREGR
jgi:flagellar biosynthesis protein FlhG